MVQLLDTSSVNILLDTNMKDDTGHFNVYCNTLKQQQQHQQASYCYSKTVLSNGNNTINTSITGLLPNTTYTCCVLAETSYGVSEPVCQNITITTYNTTVTTVTVPPHNTTFTTVIINQTPLCMTKNSTFASAIIPWIGGILVGVVSGILVMVIVWGL